MQRREFLALSGAAALTGVGDAEDVRAAESGGPQKRRSVKMYVGCQKGPTTPEMLQFYKRHAVDHICGYPPHPGPRGHWTALELEQTKALCESHGVTLDMVALPFLTSSHIDREQRGAIMLADSPERDRDIDDIHKMIEGCARAGIPSIKYNMSLLGVLRTERTPGRGGVSYSTWKLRDARPDTPLTRAGHVTAEQAWERISYFLERVIPVCEEHKIRFACHPHDPGVPPEGYQGVYRVLGTVEGLKRFVSIRESPYHGLNFCIGTIAETRAEPGREIFDVIRYFGARGKIFNVHFRNIKGRRDDFHEVFLDEGDMNMVEVARVLHEVGYDRMVMPDHVPKHPDDEGSLQAFAFSYGYIKAVLQSLESPA